MTYAELLALIARLGLSFQLPVDLTDPRLTAAQLADLNSQLQAEYVSRRSVTTPSVADLSLIRDAQAAVAAEGQSRIDATEALAALDATIPLVPVAPPTPTAEELAATAAQAASISSGDAIVIGAVIANPEAVAPEPAVVPLVLAQVASAQPAAHRDAPVVSVTPAVGWHVASAGTGIAPQNAPLDIGNIGSAISESAATMSRATRDGGMVGDAIVAAVPAFVNTPGVDPDGILTLGNGPDRNTAIISEVLANHAARLAAASTGTVHTASAPWCEPYDTIRAIPDCVSTETPFRNSLPFIPMGYGGFQFNTGISLSGVAGAVDIWTSDDQNAINPADPDTWKRCIPIVCPGSPPTISLEDWITACLEWQVGTDLNNPERVRDYFSKLEALRARVTEQYLMSLVDALTLNYKNSSASFLALGGVNDLIVALISMFQSSNYDERQSQNAGYTMYLDTAQMDALVVAEMRAAHAKTNATPAGIISYIMEKVTQLSNVVQVIDRVPGSYGTSQANGNPRAALPAVGAAFIDVPDLVTAGTIRVVPTAEVFAFGTGELRTGVRQDFSYARQNKVGWFAEEALALTKFGCSPWFRLNATICPSGYYIGAVNRNVTAETDPFACDYVADNATVNEPDPFPFGS